MTGAISFIFALLGIGSISILIAMSAYFATLYIPYYQERIETPLVISFLAGAIGFVVSGVYLSMIDVTSISVLQCYMIDEEAGKVKVEGNERVMEILNDE